MLNSFLNCRMWVIINWSYYAINCLPSFPFPRIINSRSHFIKSKIIRIYFKIIILTIHYWLFLHPLLLKSRMIDEEYFLGNIFHIKNENSQMFTSFLQLLETHFFMKKLYEIIFTKRKEYPWKEIIEKSKICYVDYFYLLYSSKIVSFVRKNRASTIDFLWIFWSWKNIISF